MRIHLFAIVCLVLLPVATANAEAIDVSADIEAIGPCQRPNKQTRIAIVERLWRPKSDSFEIRFGCEEASGIVVDVAYDERKREANYERRIGVWRIVRVDNKNIENIAMYKGAARIDWMEWSREVELRTRVLVDDDGDGIRDVIAVRFEHEGGARSGGHTELSIWHSTTKRSLAIKQTSFHQWQWLDVVAYGPLVLRTIEVARSPSGDDVEDAVSYRCWTTQKKLHVCPAVIAARRANEIRAPRPAPEVAVRSALGDLAPRSFGETDPPAVDPRTEMFRTLVGDAPCRTLTVAESAASRRAVAAFVVAHPPADTTNAQCETGTCHWSVPVAIVVTTGCTGATGSYVRAHWRHKDKKDSDILLDCDALFWLPKVAPMAGALLAETQDIGRDFGVCAACDVSVAAALPGAFHRHGADLIAVTLAPLRIFVNGVEAPVPTSIQQAWFFSVDAVDDPRHLDRLPIPNILVVPNPDQLLRAYWHWDNGWQQLANFAKPGVTTKRPALASVAAAIWDAEQRLAAIEILTESLWHAPVKRDLYVDAALDIVKRNAHPGNAALAR